EGPGLDRRDREGLLGDQVVTTPDVRGRAGPSVPARPHVAPPGARATQGDRRPGRVWRRPGQTGLWRTIGIWTHPRVPAGSRFVRTGGRIAGTDQRRAVQVIRHRRCTPPLASVPGVRDIGLVGVPFSGTS